MLARCSSLILLETKEELGIENVKSRDKKLSAEPLIASGNGSFRCFWRAGLFAHGKKLFFYSILIHPLLLTLFAS